MLQVLKWAGILIGATILGVAVVIGWNFGIMYLYELWVSS